MRTETRKAACREDVLCAMFKAQIELCTARRMLEILPGHDAIVAQIRRLYAMTGSVVGEIKARTRKGGQQA